MSTATALFLCRWLGHRREYYDVRRMCLSRRGYWQMRTLRWVRCRRCGIGREAYESGIIEEWWHRLRESWWRLLAAIEACKVPPPPRFDDDIPF